MNEQQVTLQRRVLPDFERIEYDLRVPVAVVLTECTGEWNLAKLKEQILYKQIGETAGFGGVSNRDIQRGYYYCNGTREEIERFKAVAIQAGRCLGDWVQAYVSEGAVVAPNDPIHNWLRVLSELAYGEHPGFPIESDRYFYSQDGVSELDLSKVGRWLKPIETPQDAGALYTVLVDVVKASIYGIDVLTTPKKRRQFYFMTRRGGELSVCKGYRGLPCRVTSEVMGNRLIYFAVGTDGTKLPIPDDDLPADLLATINASPESKPTGMTHTEPAADTNKKTEDETHAIKKLKCDVAKLKRATKKKTKTERIREQRNKFSRSRRPKKTWDEIYQAYRAKYPNDVKASPDTLRLAFDRNPTDNRQ